VNEEQLLQVVAYIKSLSTVKTETQTAKPPPPAASKPSATPMTKK